MMAILLRVYLHRSLSPVAKAMITRLSAWGIIDYPMNSDILHKSDLPPYDDDYFKVVTKEYFIEKYGDAKRINFIYESASPGTQQLRIPKRLEARAPRVPGNERGANTNATEDPEGSLHKHIPVLHLAMEAPCHDKT